MNTQERFLIEQRREADLARERRDLIRLGVDPARIARDQRLQVEYAAQRTDPRH